MSNASMPADSMPTLREIKAVIQELIPGAMHIVVMSVSEMAKEDIDKLFSER